ncbi:hypothetical protein [Allosphingosinicella sp.]|jgi:hypothetical protein|uniref:hypothetical protein n=1 Tax=Allosphingosinicella sp. TaxID=2823234 RepID=UPI002EFD6087
MTDSKSGAAPRRGLGAYLAEAIARLSAPGLALPAVLMLLVLTFSNIVILQNLPADGEQPGPGAIAGAAARILGLLILSVPLLRILAGSPRSPFRPDGAFFLSALGTILSLAIGTALILVIGDSQEAAGIALRTLATTLLLSPLAPWLVGLAAAVPLGWDPRRFMREVRLWLPHLLFWSMLLVFPAAILHALIDIALVKGEIDSFWPVALFDGLLSFVMLILSYALHAIAYRRVARG